MSTLYLISLIVGGFFVVLSLLGGDAEGGDMDFEADGDFELDADTDTDIGAGTGFVDLFSLRTLFLFLAFFGLTGTLLTWAGTGSTATLGIALGLGAAIGLGGNYIIKEFGYRSVSSEVTQTDLLGTTAEVVVPFGPAQKGKISLVVRGQMMRMIAQPLAADENTQFSVGDEVVITGLTGSTAEVVKPT